MKKFLLTLLAVVAIGLSASAQVMSFDELLETVELENSDCPIDCEDIGEVTSIYLNVEEHTLIYTIAVNGENVNYRSLTANSTALRNAFMQSMYEDDDTDIYKSCAYHNVSLILRFRWDALTYYDIKYTAQDLRVIFGMSAQETTSEEQAPAPVNTSDDKFSTLQGLKNEVANSNSICPISMGPTGYVESILFDDARNTITYTYVLDEMNFPYELFCANSNPQRESLVLMLASAETRAFTQACAKFNVTIVHRYTWKSSQKFDYTFTPAELNSILSTEFDETKVSQNILNQTIESTRSMCPYQALEDLTMTDVYRKDNAVYFEHTVDETEGDIAQMNRDDSDLRLFMKQSLSQMAGSIKIFVDCDCEIHYVFIGDTSGQVYEMIITKDELRQLIK